MSRQQVWTLSKIAALIGAVVGCITGASLLGAWAGKGVDVLRTPERTTTIEHRLDQLEMLCVTNFMEIHRDNEDRRLEFQELREMIRPK